MKKSPLSSRPWIAATVLVPFVGAPVTVNGALNDTVLLWGDSTDGPEMVNFQSFGGGGGSLSAAGLQRSACFHAMFAESLIRDNLESMLSGGQMDSLLAEVGLDSAGADLAESLEEPVVRDCMDEPVAGGGDMYLIFTSCSMIMGNGTGWMRWMVPPLAPEAEMVVIDTGTGEGAYVPLETRLERVNEPGVPLGELEGSNVSGPGGTKPVTLTVSPNGRGYVEREYSARQYTFNYSGDLMPPFMGAELGAMIQLGRLESDGDAWIVADAPGADVISAFYQNFKSHVAPAAGMSTLLGGAISQMSDIASNGIPVEPTQTTTMSGGILSMMGALGGGSSQKSTSTVSKIMILPGDAPVTCAPAVIPAGIQMTDLGAEMEAALAQASGGPGGTTTPPGGESAGAAFGVTPEGMPDIAEAMSAITAALGELPPEQQEMIRSLGLSGSVVPGATPAAPVAAQPPTAAAAPTRVIPSAEELNSDNLTQMVQNHLAVLGYNTGNTTGELSTATVIAISQFQAERGLEVTGEVTPQLAGILSAAVDALR